MSRFFVYRCIICFLTLYVALTSATFAQAQATTAELGVFAPFEVAPGGEIQIPVSIRNVQDLYGLDFTLQFDPTLVQVKDSDPTMPGVQAALGDFLDPGLLLFNSADNQKGTLHFAMAQYNPSEPKSGEGVILVISFTGVATGVSPLSITSVQLASPEAVEIHSTGVDSTLTVTSGAPTQSITYAVVELKGLIIVGTATPTPTYSPTAEAAFATPLASPKTDGQMEQATISTQMSGESHNAQYFLVDHWWIVLILALAVIVSGVFLFGKRKNN